MTTDERFRGILRSKWAAMKEPIRPSAEENRLYEKYVAHASQNRDTEVLILGATPDLRDLAIRYGLRPVSSDLDQRIWESMSDFMNERGEEEFILGNWLDLPTHRTFGLILADGSFNMLSEKEARPFFARTAALLRDGGFSVQRILYVNPDLTVDDFVRAVEQHRENENPMSLYLYTVLLVNSIRENQYAQLTKEELLEQVLFEHLTTEEADSLRSFSYGGRLYFPPRSVLHGMLETHFTVEEVVESHGPGYWEMAAQYVLKKKG